MRADQRRRQDAVRQVVVEDLSHPCRVAEQPMQFGVSEFPKRIVRGHEVRIVYATAVFERRSTI